jgi:hypothetical protein
VILNKLFPYDKVWKSRSHNIFQAPCTIYSYLSCLTTINSIANTHTIFLAPCIIYSYLSCLTAINSIAKQTHIKMSHKKLDCVCNPLGLREWSPGIPGCDCEGSSAGTGERLILGSLIFVNLTIIFMRFKEMCFLIK